MLLCAQHLLITQYQNKSVTVDENNPNENWDYYFPEENQAFSFLIPYSPYSHF